MICVDTSVWIAAVRNPASAAGQHLFRLLEHGLVALAAPVRLELQAGAGSRVAERFASGAAALPVMVPARETWQQAGRWLLDAAKAGQRFGALDVLLAAIAGERKLRVWSLDGDFTRLAKLGYVELYTPEAITSDDA